MNVDKFGRYHWTQHRSRKGDPGVGFKLTSTGDFDIENRKLVNTANPDNTSDAANKIYVDNSYDNAASRIAQIEKALPGMVESKIAAYGLENCLHFNESVTLERQYDAKQKRIIQVKYPEQTYDAVNKKYVDELESRFESTIKRLETDIQILQQKL